MKFRKYFLNNSSSSSVIKKNINNNENILKFFSSRDSTNNIFESKRVNNPIYQNFILNTDISKPFISTRNSFYSLKSKYSNQKLNDFPQNYYNNQIIPNKLSKSKKNLYKLTDNTNYNYIDNGQTKNIFKINNKIFIENLKFKSVKKDNKDYTNLLISKTETHYPLSTFYRSPKYDSNYSAFNNLFSSFKKSHSNSHYKNNSQEIKKKDVILFPGGRRTFGNRSISENKIFFGKSNNFNSLNYSSINRSNSNNSNYYRDLKNEFLSIYKESKRRFFFRKTLFDLEKNIKNAKDLTLILISIFKNKMYILKKDFFLKINKKINPLTLNSNNINDYNNCLFPKLVDINRKLKKNNISKFKFNNASNIKINKKNNNKIYIPKISIKNNNHLSTIYSSINNKIKQRNLHFNNNLTESKNRKIKFQRYSKLEKTSNIENKKFHNKNVLSLDISNDNSLKPNIFSEKNLYNKNNSKFIYEPKKAIRERNSSFGKIYKKKLGRNNTNKIFSQKQKKSLNNKEIIKEKLNLNINNGMLIDYIISSDEKLYIIVKCVVLINKRTNNLNYLSSFNQSNFKIDRIYYLNIINNVLTIYSYKDKENKIKNSKLKEIITNNIISNSNKNGIVHYKNKKKYFMNYLKIKSFYNILQKYIFLLVFKKILHFKIINNKDPNKHNSKDISKFKISKNTTNYNCSFNGENKKIIRVKKAKKFKNLEKLKEKIININNRMNKKIIKKFLEKWKERKRIHELKIIHNKIIVNKSNNLLKYKQKLISVLKNSLFLIRFQLISFALHNKGIINYLSS